MVSCFRFCYVLIPLIFSIATIVLGALAIAGSTKASLPVSDIYLIKINLTEASSTVNSALDGTGSSLSSLGLSEIYTFGMWGYCKGSTDSEGGYNVESCSDPKAMYLFDPVTTLENDLGSSGITLPDDVDSYISTAKVISKLIFITGIIGVCTALLVGIATVLSFCSHVISCLSTFLGVISFLATVICAAASTGAFLIVKKYFNNAFDDYGIKATLSNYHFYGLIWGAAAAALLCALFNFFAICCGRTRSRSRSIEEEPMMEYKERSFDE